MEIDNDLICKALRRGVGANVVCNGLRGDYLEAEDLLPYFASVSAAHGRSASRGFSNALPQAYCFAVVTAGPYQMDDSFLDPHFDRDFTNGNNVAKPHRRPHGRRGLVWSYMPPIGYKRYGLNVLGKYANGDTWLHGDRRLEWPVSYHGTRKQSAKAIAEGSYDLKLARRQVYGRGIYTTPSIVVAEMYAPTFEHEGNLYRVVVQNRVNPDTTRIIPAHLTGVDAPYYLSASTDDVRAYGLLIRQLRLNGFVKWFHCLKGHGFITRLDTGDDVFVHRSAIVDNDTLEEGEDVEFVVVQGMKGLQASDVTGPNSAPVFGSSRYGNRDYY